MQSLQNLPGRAHPHSMRVGECITDLHLCETASILFTTAGHLVEGCAQAPCALCGIHRSCTSCCCAVSVAVHMCGCACRHPAYAVASNCRLRVLSVTSLQGVRLQEWRRGCLPNILRLPAQGDVIGVRNVGLRQYEPGSICEKDLRYLCSALDGVDDQTVLRSCAPLARLLLLVRALVEHTSAAAPYSLLVELFLVSSLHMRASGSAVASVRA